MNNEVKVILENSKKIIIGLSGGADSIALTHILFKQFGSEKLLCLHVNHSIRGQEADQDQAFVKKFCNAFNIKLQILQVDVPKIVKETGESSEECGRRLRYEFFQSNAEENFVIATAHNADDNAETVLLNLIRGTGVKGLCGIPAVRGNIVRPILDMSRSSIEKYCEENQLKFVTDSTNLENDYSRNKIRNQIFPILKDINFKAVENINRSSKNLGENWDFLNKESEVILQKAKTKYGLKTEFLNSQDEYMLKNAIYIFLTSNKIFSAEEKHISEIVRIIRENTGAVMLPNKIKVQVSQGILHIDFNIYLEKQEIILDEIVKYGNKMLILKKNYDTCEKINNLLFKNFIDCDKIEGKLWVDKRQEGDIFHALGKDTAQSIKKLFNQRKIPTGKRNEIIIIRDDKNIVYVENFGISENYKIDEKSKNIIEVKIREKDE